MADLSELLTVGGTASVTRTGDDPYSKWSVDPSPENMRAVLDDLSPTINSEIQRFSGPKPLLRSKARIIAVSAVRSFNPASGAKLRSWVTTQLQQLSRYNNSIKPIYTPEDAARKAYAVRKASDDFVNETGREPTDKELADAVGISVARLKKLRTAAPAVVNEPDMSAADDDNAPEYAVYSSSPVQAAQDAVYRSIGDRDRMIFDMKTGLHGSKELSGGEIAKKLGVTPAFVSQRAADIANKILHYSQSRGM